MNIKDAYIHNGDAILKDIQLNGSKLQKLKAGKNADDTYLIWDDVVDLSPFGASGHNHDDRYLKLTGGTMSNTNVVTNLNADLLDGYHKNDILRRTNAPTSVISLNNVVTDGIDFTSWDYAHSVNVNNQPWGDGASSAASVVSFGTDYPFQIYSDYSTTSYLYYRSYYAGNGWKDWRQFAFLDSNVASASKWANARTITLTGSVTGSVSIDGSADVTLATTTNHTHNYAGSSSAGGSADSALTLLYNNKFDTTYGDYAIFQQNYNISDFPHDGWFNSIKMLHNNSHGYFTEIATSFTGEDGMWRRALVGGGQLGWYKMLDSGNFNSYALPLSGGTMSGSITMSSGAYIIFNGSLGAGTGSYLAFSGDNLYLAASKSGQKIYLESTYQSAPYFRNQYGDYVILHSGNYTTYTVKKDGTGASGNWGISITGNAATATTSTYASNVGSSGTAGTNYVTAANVISMYNWYNSITATDEASNTAIDKWNEIVSFLTGITDTSTLSGILAGYAAADHTHPYLPTTQVSMEQASNDDWIKKHALSTLRGHVYNTHSLEWQYLFGISSGKTYGSILRTSYGNGTPRIQVMGLFDGTWSSWREVAYDDNTVKKDGTGASGTWGISITGNAGYASSAGYADSAGSARNLLGRTTTGSDYGAVDGNLVFAEWSTYSDNRWYLKAKGYETRVGYANNSDKLDGQDLITQVSDWNTDSLSIFKSSEGSISNAPTTDGIYGLTLRFHRQDSTYHTDLVTNVYSDKLFFRRKTESGYGSWRELIHSGNYTSYLGYIGTTAVQASSAAQALTGITAFTFNGVTSAGTNYITGTAGRIYFGGNFHIDSLESNATYINHYTANNVYLVSGSSQGNVGIGTTSPSQKLEVSGNIRVLNPSDNQIIARFLNYSSAPYGLMIKSYTNGSLHLQSQRESDNSEVFSLLLNPNGGNVGIGTFDPYTKLHINGGSLRIDNNSKYVTIGCGNTSFCHYKTDADTAHWFNKTVQVNGNIEPYGNNAYSAGSISYRFSNIYSYAGNFAGTISSDNYHQIYNNGSYTRTSNSVKGAIVIQLPITSDQWDMINVEIAVYEYNSQAASKIIVGGHPWKGKWYNYSCSIIGGYNKEVRLGIYGGKWCIILGTSSTVWSYPGVFVTHIGTVYDTYSSAYTSQCTLSLITNESDFSALTTPANVVNATYASSAGSVAWANVSNKPAFTTWSETSSTASYSLSNAAWTNTITLPTTAGSYILNIVSGNSTLTGVFSIGANDNAKDEISLHLHGNGPRLYARTNGTTLQLSSNDASATSRSVTIKYRRMI